MTDDNFHIQTIFPRDGCAKAVGYVLTGETTWTREAVWNEEVLKL